MKALALLLLFPLSLTAQPAARKRAVVVAPSMERLLVPMAGELAEPGAYWVAELVLKNDNHFPVQMFYPWPCQITGCPAPQPFVLLPDEMTGNTNNFLRHAFLSVDRGGVDDLAYSLRVVDISKTSYTQPVLGTELPLVRERDFRPSVHIVNLPTDPADATIMLRVYALGVNATDVDVEVLADTYPYRQDVSFSHEKVTLNAGKRVSGFDAFPAWSVVDLRPRLSPELPKNRFGLRVTSLTSDVKIWAFVMIHQPGQMNPTIVTPRR